MSRLKPGDTFFTTTKRMTKDRHNNLWNAELNGPRITYEVLRPGMRRYFEKGKRKYFCEVMGITDIKTGLYPGSIIKISKSWMAAPHLKRAIRYWQFTYLVMVVEN